MMMLTIAQFCEDMENFNDWSVSTPRLLSKALTTTGRYRWTSPLESFPQIFSSRSNDTVVAHEAEEFEAEHQEKRQLVP